MKHNTNIYKHSMLSTNNINQFNPIKVEEAGAKAKLNGV